MHYLRKRESYFNYAGMELPINADKDYLCVDKYLSKLAEQMARSLEYHSRIVLARFDLTAFERVEDNQPIEELIRRIKIWLNREYRMKNVGHFWVRENSEERGLHWHVLIMLDGNKVRSNFTLNEFVRSYWTYRDIGNFSYPRKHSYYQIERNDSQAFADGFYHASYLTKERSKGVKARHVCQFGASKLRAKP